jgi:hypothetical protein
MATLCTRQQVKDRIGITTSDSDTQIDTIIAAVTQTVQRRYGREFVPQTNGVARTFRVNSRYVDLAPYDLASAATIQLNPEDANPLSLVANVDYALMPIGGAEKTTTFLGVRLSDALNIESNFYRNFGFAQLKITGNWGIWADASAVAEDIVEAAIETSVAWLDRPSNDIAIIDSDPRRTGPAVPQTWDIPASAHRKFQLYGRNLGVY